MKVMVLVKATADSEAGVMPSPELLEAMGKFNEELVDAGVMLAGEGLKPTSQAVRIGFDGPGRRVIDGPFAETREFLAGFNLIEAESMEAAMEIAQAFPWARFGSIEVRPLEDMDAERERCGAPAAATAAAVP